MLQAINLGVRRGVKLLFENTHFQIHPEQKVGLTGANGTGKSSLFALILNQLQADTGDCLYPDNWVIAHVAQEIPDGSQHAIDFVLDGDVELRQIQKNIDKAESDNNGVLLATLHTQLDNINGYSANARASQLLSGLGFKPSDENRIINEFSGGWRMRLNLGKALMCRSDLLLLDEPTNHLDLDTIIWLESWLSAYRGTLLLISHDRDFLNNICTHIAHLEQQTIQLYTGNYTAFEHIRAERLANQQSEFIKQQRNIAHIESYITRFRAKATKAKQAQSRLKALERMQVIAPAHVDSPFHFSLFEPEKTPNSLLHMEHIDAGYNNADDDFTYILKNINFQLLPGDRIGLLGPNGAGKSTFIKVLANKLKVSSGEYHLAKETKIGYFAQHQLEQLHDEHTALEHLQQLDKNARESDLRNYLGRFGFSNDMVLEKINIFSGGEKSRLVLAMLIYQRPNLLLLDEPTNHLDLEMREALAEALQEFSGAMVIVSHDRHLLNVTCDKLLLVNNQSVDEFSLSLDDYPKWLSDHNNALLKTGSSSNDQSISKKERKRLEAERRQKTAPLRKRIKALESSMKSLSSKINEITSQLSDNDIYAEHNKDKLQKLLINKAELDKSHESDELEWLDICEQLEETE